MRDQSFYPRSGCLVIGLTGPIGVGKTTMADMIEMHASVVARSGRLMSREDCAADVLGSKLPSVLRTSFAAPMRRALEGLWPGFSKMPKATPAVRLHGKAPRELLRALGTAWGRELVHPAIWTSLWAEEVQAHWDLHVGERAKGARDPLRTIVVVDDVRYPNEAEAVRAFGGVICELRRKEVTPVAVDHSSEVREFTPDYAVDTSCPRLLPKPTPDSAVDGSVVASAEILLVDAVVRAGWLIARNRMWDHPHLPHPAGWVDSRVEFPFVAPRMAAAEGK